MKLVELQITRAKTSNAINQKVQTFNYYKPKLIYLHLRPHMINVKVHITQDIKSRTNAMKNVNTTLRRNIIAVIGKLRGNVVFNLRDQITAELRRLNIR